MIKILLIPGLIALLSACGGDGFEPTVSQIEPTVSQIEPTVSQIQANSLRYGQIANISVAGKFMRNDMVADTGTCTNPLYSTNSTPDLATLTCRVTATGPLPITIKSASGATLFSDTLTVLPPVVTLVTSKGNVVMELDPTKAPVTVNNFLSYVSSGYYANTLFHRVIAGFVVQGGGFTTGMVKKAGQAAPIVLESNTGLFNSRATVAMARTNVPDSATSEFFINLIDNRSLDYRSAASPGYAVFGKVLTGMDVIDAIAALPTATVNGIGNIPTADVTISLALQTQ